MIHDSKQFIKYPNGHIRMLKPKRVNRAPKGKRTPKVWIEGKGLVDRSTIDSTNNDNSE